MKAVLVGTGQTTLIQGGKYGVALDALVPQFCSGEVEDQVVAAFEGEHPDVIVVEGQGALSHPAYLTSAHILRGSRPAGVIVQHAPRRETLGDFPMMPMPTVASEVALIEAFADTKVIGIALNHEQMTDEDVSASIARLQEELGLPVTDPLTRPLDRLVDMVARAFPEIGSLARRDHAVTLPRLDIDLERDHAEHSGPGRSALPHGHSRHGRHQGRVGLTSGRVRDAGRRRGGSGRLTGPEPGPVARRGARCASDLDPVSHAEPG